MIVVSDQLDSSLSSNCFANRRAIGNQSSKSLLQDFAKESWPNFCNWQKKCVEKYNILLRTDISSFYDSVSHDYLTEIIKDQLAIDKKTDVMKLFKKILQVPVVSYSQLTRKPLEPPEKMKQGLPIGNQTEGMLANIYLKNIDESMQQYGVIDFGRYNDDMRIFAEKRHHALDAVLVLQQLLLTKGLNLNAGKTEIAEGRVNMIKLRSKDYDVYEYFAEEDRQEVTANVIIKRIDQNFDEFTTRFEPDEKIDKDKKAKEFCKFLSTVNKQKEMLLPLQQRRPEHIMNLGEILVKFGGSSKHASWLIVQSAYYPAIPQETQIKAKEILFNSIQNEEVNSYAKYRLLHHLIKPRKRDNSEFRFFDQLSAEEKEKLHDLLPSLLQQPTFELNIISLYILKIMGANRSELEEYVKKYIPKPIGEPIKNALSYCSEPVEMVKFVEIATVEEPDNIPEQY